MASSVTRTTALTCSKRSTEPVIPTPRKAHSTRTCSTTSSCELVDKDSVVIGLLSDTGDHLNRLAVLATVRTIVSTLVLPFPQDTAHTKTLVTIAAFVELNEVFKSGTKVARQKTTLNIVPCFNFCQRKTTTLPVKIAA